jgi:hypothetical protein
MVTEVGEKKRSPIVTLADADLWAPPPEPSAGDPRPSCVDGSPVLLAASLGVPAAGSVGGAWGGLGFDWLLGVSAGVGEATGFVGSVVVVVVVASVVVPASCATEIAGMAQLNARTSIPLARALAPFILRIVVRGIDS